MQTRFVLVPDDRPVVTAFPGARTYVAGSGLRVMYVCERWKR